MTVHSKRTMCKNLTIRRDVTRMRKLGRPASGRTGAGSFPAPCVVPRVGLVINPARRLPYATAPHATAPHTTAALRDIVRTAMVSSDIVHTATVSTGARLPTGATGVRCRPAAGPRAMRVDHVLGEHA